MDEVILSCYNYGSLAAEHNYCYRTLNTQLRMKGFELFRKLAVQVSNLRLEIRFRKNLAKLKGSAVRIKSKKLKGKKTMKEKKNRKLPRGDLNPHPNFLQRKKCGLLPVGHAIEPPFYCKINNFEVSFSAIHTV